MTKLQKVTLQRIERLVNSLHNDMCQIEHYLSAGPEKIKEIDKERQNAWAENNKAKLELNDLVSALLAEADEKK